MLFFLTSNFPLPHEKLDHPPPKLLHLLVRHCNEIAMGDNITLIILQAFCFLSTRNTRICPKKCYCQWGARPIWHVIFRLDVKWRKLIWLITQDGYKYEGWVKKEGWYCVAGSPNNESYKNKSYTQCMFMYPCPKRHNWEHIFNQSINQCV